jgi:hypothetical protein
MHSRKAREESPQAAGQHGDNLGDGHRSSPRVYRGSHRASSRRGVLARLRDRLLTHSDEAPALVGRELGLPVRAHDEAPLTGRVLSELDGQAWQQAILDDGEFEAWQQTMLDGRPMGRWLGLGLSSGEDGASPGLPT